jgi:hypothetical protein
MAKPRSPKPNSITVNSGTPDAEATRKNEEKKRKREDENEHVMSRAVDAGADRFPRLSREQVAMGVETTYGPESKKRKKGKEAGNIDGESMDGASDSAFSYLGADRPLPRKALRSSESNPTFPPAKKAKRNSERKTKNGGKKLGVKILARTESVEKNGWMCFQRVKG